MSERVAELAALAVGFAARHVYRIGGEFRCSECLRAWTDADAARHAETCVVAQIGVLATEVVLDESRVKRALRGAAGKVKQFPGGDESQKSHGDCLEPWRIATAAETDPCAAFAGALVNANDEVIARPEWMGVDYRKAAVVLMRAKECVNFFAGVPTLAIIGTGELTRERIAEVGGVGAATGVASGEWPVASEALCADGATA